LQLSTCTLQQSVGLQPILTAYINPSQAQSWCDGITGTRQMSKNVQQLWSNGTVKVNRQLISQALLSNRTDIHRMAAIHCYSISVSFLVPDNSITTLTFVVPRQFLQLYPSVSTIDCTFERSVNYQTHQYSQSCFNIL